MKHLILVAALCLFAAPAYSCPEHEGKSAKTCDHKDGKSCSKHQKAAKASTTKADKKVQETVVAK